MDSNEQTPATSTGAATPSDRTAASRLRWAVEVWRLRSARRRGCAVRRVCMLSSFLPRGVP